MRREILNSSIAKLRGTEIAKDSNNNKIYFIGADKEIYCIDLSNSSFPINSLSDLIPEGGLKAADSTNLIYTNNQIFFVSRSNKVSCYRYSEGGWNSFTLDNSAQDVCSNGSICLDEEGKIFYIGSDGRLYHFLLKDDKWKSDLLSEPNQIASTNSNLYSRNNNVYYIGRNKKLCRYFKKSNSWHNEVVCLSSPNASKGTTIEQDESNRIYYVTEDQSVCQLNVNKSSCSWSIISNTRVKEGSAIKLEPTGRKIYLLDSLTNTLAVFVYREKSGWVKIMLNSTQNEEGIGEPITYIDELLFTSNNDIIYSDESDNKLYLLSPIIQWKSRNIANGLTAYINNSTGQIASPETSISIVMRPFNFQFYPRDSMNKGVVHCEGNVLGFSEISFKVEKTNFAGVLSSWISAPTTISNLGAFTTSFSIEAELSEYRILYKLNGQTTYVELADKIVCGDAYIASGQSNIAAITGELNQCTINNQFGGATDYGKYSRTFGDFITECRNWGVSTANNDMRLYSCSNPVGALILPLQYKIQQAFGIPTCILNNGLGGTSIDDHILNLNDKFYFEYNPNWKFKNSEGHLMRRIYAAGLERNIRGLIWYQGENDANSNITKGLYKQKFKQLYDGLAANLQSLSSHSQTKESKTYLIQIHSFPANYPWANMISEDQRTIGNFMPYANIEVIPSNGAKYPNCNGHFSESGYEDIASRIFNRMSVDLYNGAFDLAKTAPEIIEARLDSNKITLVFNQSISVQSPDSSAEILDAIEVSNFENKSNFSINGALVSFNVSSTLNLKHISYLGSLPPHLGAAYSSPGCSAFQTQTPCIPESTTQVLPEWWSHAYLRNSSGIPPLSFYKYPLTISKKAIEFDAMLLVYPNPAGDEVEFLSKTTILELKIIDPQGRLVLITNEKNEGQLTINTCDFSNGIYTAFVKTESGITAKKIVILRRNGE